MQAIQAPLDRFLDPGKSEAAQTAALGEILAQLRCLRPANILKLVVQLQPYLTAEDDLLRTRSIFFLAEVLRKASVDVPLDAQQAAHVLVFLEARLDDYPSLADSLLALEALVRHHSDAVAGIASLNDNPNDVKNPVAALAHDLSEKIHLPALSQLIRHRGYRVFAAIFSEACSSLRPLLQQEIKKVGLAFCSAIEGEKDPRCLLVALEAGAAMLRLLCGRSSSEIVEPVFEIFSVYFPISFSPPKNDPYKIRPEDLKAALAEILFCRSTDGRYYVAPHTQALLLEKFSDQTTDGAVKEAIKAYQICIEKFPTNDILPQAPHMVTHLLGVATSDSEEKDSSLEVLFLLARKLELAQAESFSRVMSPLVERCATDLLEGITQPSGGERSAKVIGKLAAAGPRTLGLILRYALNRLVDVAMVTNEPKEGPMIQASQAAALVTIVSLTKAIDPMVEYTGISDEHVETTYGFPPDSAIRVIDVLLSFLKLTRRPLVETGDDAQLLISCRCLSIEGCGNLLSRPPTPLLSPINRRRLQEILLSLSISVAETAQVHSVAVDAVKDVVSRRPMAIAGTPFSTQLLAKFSGLLSELDEPHPLSAQNQDRAKSDSSTEYSVAEYVSSSHACSSDDTKERDRLLNTLSAIGVTNGSLFVSVTHQLVKVAWADPAKCADLIASVGQMFEAFCVPKSEGTLVQDVTTYAEHLLALLEQSDLKRNDESETVLGALLDTAVCASFAAGNQQTSETVQAVAKSFGRIVRAWASIDRKLSQEGENNGDLKEMLGRLRSAQAKCLEMTCTAVTEVNVGYKQSLSRSGGTASQASNKVLSSRSMCLCEIFYNVISQVTSSIPIFLDDGWVESIVRWIQTTNPDEDDKTSPKHQFGIFGALLLRIPEKNAVGIIENVLSWNIAASSAATDLTFLRLLAQATRVAFLRRDVQSLDLRCLQRFLECCLDPNSPFLIGLEKAAIFGTVCDGETVVGLQETALWRQKLMAVTYGQLSGKINIDNPVANPAAVMLSLLFEHSPKHLLSALDSEKLVDDALNLLHVLQRRSVETTVESIKLLQPFGALQVLQDVLSRSPDTIEGNILRLVPVLLDVIRDATAARCRYLAIEILFQLTELPVSTLLKVRGQVISGLASGFGVRSKEQFGVDDPQKGCASYGSSNPKQVDNDGRNVENKNPHVFDR